MEVPFKEPAPMCHGFRFRSQRHKWVVFPGFSTLLKFFFCSSFPVSSKINALFDVLSFADDDEDLLLQLYEVVCKCMK